MFLVPSEKRGDSPAITRGEMEPVWQASSFIGVEKRPVALQKRNNAGASMRAVAILQRARRLRRWLCGGPDPII
jgi:hypothetical protein